MDYIITTEQLTKKYKNFTSVNHVSLHIRKGSIYGFLGPNGAGKSTTMKMLLGLTAPTKGSFTIDGKQFPQDRIAILKEIGSFIEAPSFYANLTGRENLDIIRRILGLPKADVEDALELVGLTEFGDRLAKKYSLGMKQRLGIADVLMKDPEVIIMDEPTLGIDPEGVRELIELIRNLSTEDGRTILISSHQLYQIQQICDRVGIFVAGKLIACGPIKELGRQLESEGSYILELSVEPDDGTLEKKLAELEGVSSVTRQEEIIHVESTGDIRPRLMPLLLEGGYQLLHLHLRGGDLDEIYRRYFEKAGESGEHPTAERKRPGILEQLWKKQKS